MVKNKHIIINFIATIIILVGFIVYNFIIYQNHRHRCNLTPDGEKYCYGIDSFEQEDESYVLEGWFFEVKSIRGEKQIVSDEDAELALALIPIDEAEEGRIVENATFMNMVMIHDERPDVNNYFSCEYDYSKCGFTATVDCEDIDLLNNSYRVAVKPDTNMSTKAILTNVYLTDEGISYTNPSQSPELDVEGTDLSEIVNNGVRLSSRPDFNCYIYQFDDKIYWIADEGFSFCDSGETYIQYHINTTQIKNLPQERLENGWLWSNIGDDFEKHEITNQMNSGKYRVSMRSIPSDYSVINISTGYFDETWVWASDFKPIFKMLM